MNINSSVAQTHNSLLSKPSRLALDAHCSPKKAQFVTFRGIYSRGSLEETKSWLRKLIRRKVLSESSATEYKAIVEKPGPKLNAFINSTKA
jgi:four helix bundle protein